MSQQELKQIACTAAYQLMSALCQIQDGDFVDGVLSAVSSNDEIMLISLMYEE